jgi:two-component system, LytTR family, response regulator
MLRAIHIEDEKRNVLLLDSLIKEHCSEYINILGSASNIDDAIDLIKKTKPHLVFLDIELDGGNSFQLLDKIGEFTFQVLFITAYNNHAIKAFKYNAIDYLLKPIDIEELKIATKKVLQRVEDPNTSEGLENLIKFLKDNNKAQKIGVTVHDGVLFVDTEDILRIEAKNSYSLLYFSNKKVVTTSHNIGYFENLLPKSIFIRVHNSWIINTKYLKKYYRGKNGYLEMDDGATVQVSIRKKGDLLDFINYV